MYLFIINIWKISSRNILLTDIKLRLIFLLAMMLLAITIRIGLTNYNYDDTIDAST